MFIACYLIGCETTEEIKETDLVVLLNQGAAFAEKGQYDRAIAYFNKAIEINPKLAEAYYNRGLVYKEKGQYDKAISDFTKAIEINPRHADAYYSRGVVYYYKKDYEKALDDFYKAQKLGLNVPPGIFQLLGERSGKQK